MTSKPSFNEAAIKMRNEILSKDCGDVVAARRMHEKIVANKAETNA